jgi:endonuclease YncB( thermonuclease family)
VKTRSLILLFSVVASANAAAGDFAGRVVAVHDGDTLTVLTPDHHQVKVRLAEIDAPECGQPWSVRSKRVPAYKSSAKPA